MNSRGFTAGTIDAEKIAAIPINEPEGAPLPEGMPTSAEQAVWIDAATFYEQRFKMVFDIASEATAIPGVSPTGQQIKSIAIQPEEGDIPRKVSDQLYALCRKYTFLQPILKPGGDSIQAAFLVYVFFKNKIDMIKAEVRAQMAQPIEAERKAA